MDKRTFEKLQNHVFDEGNPWDIWIDGSTDKPNRLPYFSTWAIWKEGKDAEDLSLINAENADKLKPNKIFVAFNFGGRLKNDWAFWQNIHGVPRVKNLLHGTRFEGAYMTDIIKDYPSPKPQEVWKEIKKNTERRDRNIRWFFEEMDLLGVDNIEMYLFGEAVETFFKKYVMKNDKFSEFNKKLIKCQRIYHYSNRVRGNKLERFGRTQLGIESKKGAKIYEPLWPVTG